MPSITSILLTVSGVLALLLGIAGAEIHRQDGELATYAEISHSANEEMAKNKGDSDVYIKQLDKAHLTAIKSAAVAWAAYDKCLRVASCGKAPEPISIPADFCESPHACLGLSDELSKFESQVDAAITSYRVGVATLLSDASDKQTERDECDGWAAAEQQINAH